MQDSIQTVVDQVSRVLLGKEEKIKLALACLLSDGHLLIEDLPGMGKTTLAHALAKVLGLSYQRVQFTSDMLPADILGVSVYGREEAGFQFHPGPVFTQLLLADEINRTTPKTQSALLEAMEERQVTVEGQTRPLPDPFFVIATQNPLTQMGTFPLPESQLDRFFMRISLGYPEAEAEKRILMGGDPRQGLKDLNACLTPDHLLTIKRKIETIQTSDHLLGYVQRLVHTTRNHPEVACGISPRGAMALLKAAKAWAYIQNRAYVIVEDVQAMTPWVIAHRLAPVPGNHAGAEHSLVTSILQEVDTVPS